MASTASSAGSVSTRLRVVLGDVTGYSGRAGPVAASRTGDEGLRRNLPAGRRASADRLTGPADANQPVRPGKLPPMTDVTSDAAATRLRRSPLHDRHAALGAKFAPFGGWEMPLEYAGGGVLQEHAAVRERGRRLRRLAPGQGAGRRARRGRRSSTPASPTTWTGSAPGRRSTRCAATTRPAAWSTTSSPTCTPTTTSSSSRTRPTPPRWSAGCAPPRPPGSTVTDEHEAYAVLAVQGPRSAELLARARPAHRARLHELRHRQPRRGAADRVPHRLHRRARLRAGRAGRSTRWPSGTRCFAAGAAYGLRAVRARRPGHAAHRDGLPAARPGPLAGDHPGAGPLRLGGRLGQAGVLGPRRAARREGGRPAPYAVGPGGASTGASRAPT